MKVVNHIERRITMINVKNAIRNNRSLIGACIVGCGITYSLISHACEHQKLTDRLRTDERCIDILFNILEREGIIQRAKTN